MIGKCWLSNGNRTHLVHSVESQKRGYQTSRLLLDNEAYAACEDKGQCYDYKEILNPECISEHRLLKLKSG